MENCAVPLVLTAAARQKITDLGGALRVFLEDGGCCGTAYAFGAELPHPGDHVWTDGALTLACPAAARPLLGGAKLDYGARLKPPRFRVLANPNTPLRCACNRSFGRPFPGKVTPQCRAYRPMPWDADALSC